MNKILFSGILGLSITITLSTTCMAADQTATTNKVFETKPLVLTSSETGSDYMTLSNCIPKDNLTAATNNIAIVLPQDTCNATGDLGAFDETDVRTFGIASNDQRIDFEGRGGMTLRAGAAITCKFYSHSSKLLPDGVVTLKCVSLPWKQREAEGEGTVVLQSFEYDKSYSIPTAELADGTYSIRCHFKEDGVASGILCEGFFVKRGKTFKVCRVAEGSDEEVAESWNSFCEFMSKTKPENNLRVDNLSYPSDYHSDYNAADDIIKTCDEKIIKHKDWSDELKVYAIIEWMRKNYAYDDWYANQVDGKHKFRNGDDWTNPNCFITRTNVGVCYDFANILVIMCRHLGIPACTINNDRHIWCGVYLNGSWVSIDPTKMMDYHCLYEDENPAQWIKVVGNYQHYGAVNGETGNEINSWHLRTYKD
ncbi:MAG: hypothetical protein K6G03_03755 [Lachnospiraceae bacterium]|nr:hypothetical protein [Lachnospiraceae bacterium]